MKEGWTSLPLAMRQELLPMDWNGIIGRWKCATQKYRKDEGRPLGVGLQERAPNHLKLLW